MKILFIYPTIGNMVEYQYGIASISALLKKNGHNTNLLRVNKKISKNLLLSIVTKINPDVICFSFVSNHWKYVKEYSDWIKKSFPKLPIVTGGIHATTCPEEVISHSSIDIVCIGEGEYPLLELVNSLEERRTDYAIQNLWFKQGSGIIKNGLRLLIQDLDILPFGDRELFYPKQKYVRELYMMAGRGCPYQCSYCCNHLLQKIYAEKGKYIRMRSVDVVLNEIEEASKKYTFDQITFDDDTFTLNINWVEEFAEKYSKKFSFPFSVNARVENINDRLLKVLKKAGCRHIGMAIESGSEWLRKNVLKRYMTNKQIVDAFNLTKKYGLVAGTYYIFGFPLETEEMMKDTIKIHEQANSTGGFQLTIFYPYPSTHLHDICKKENLLTRKRKDTFGAGFIGAGGYSTLNFDRKHKRMLKRYYWKMLDMQYKENDFGYKWVKTHHNKLIYSIYQLLSLFIGPSKAFMFMLSFKKLFIPKIYLT